MRKRILVVHPVLAPFGGGEGVCAWILDGLKKDYELTLLTWERPDFSALNRFYGTALSERDVNVQLATPILPARLAGFPYMRRLRLWSLFAQARRRHDHDLAITTEEEGDVGEPAIQYVHFPRFDFLHSDGRRHPLHTLAIRGYYRFIGRLTGFSMERMRRSVTVVNSDWTGVKMAAAHHVRTCTIHPPAAGEYGDVPWEARADRFICVGRLSPEKRIELVVEIIAAVRARGFDVALDIVGKASDPVYGARIAALLERHRDFITLHQDIPRAKLVSLLGHARYGIHGMAEEHFGMAIAEMVSAGLIAFTPCGGGQVEITAEPRLTFADKDEAVDKITAMLSDPALTAQLRAHLSARREHLGPARFVREIRTLVQQTLP